MKVEKITRKSSDRCLNVTASHVDSLRINNDVSSTVRVYDNGCIGVEGALGVCDMALLEQKATAKLAQGIPYPETHDQAKVISVDNSTHIFDEAEFIPAIQKLLARLEVENPDFLFNNKVFLNSSEATYQNSDGSNLNYKGNQFVISLTIKHKGSANIMDESYGCEGDYFDEEQICHDVKLKCDAFLNKLPQIEEDEVIIIGDAEPLQHAISHFIADMYFNKASLFDGKLGQKIFNDKLNVTVNRDPKEQINIPFFDAEGVVNDNFKNYIIKEGVFACTLTNKKSSAQYNTPNLGSAGASYNGVPVVGAGGFEIVNTANSLADLVDGKAVYLSVTSGGDMTPSGDIGMPVMVAYLYENGKLLGKLPEFTVSVNIFDVLGNGFVGSTDKGLFHFGKQHYLVYRAKLVNKQ